MIINSTTELPKKEDDKNYIFLAGSMDGNFSPNWRNRVINSLSKKKNFFRPYHKKIQ